MIDVKYEADSVNSLRHDIRDQVDEIFSFSGLRKLMSGAHVVSITSRD